LTGPISLAGAVGSLIGLKVIFLPAGQVILSDFLNAEAYNLVSSTSSSRSTIHAFCVTKITFVENLRRSHTQPIGRGRDLYADYVGCKILWGVTSARGIQLAACSSSIFSYERQFVHFKPLTSRVLRLGLLQDGDVGVGVFPERKSSYIATPLLPNRQKLVCCCVSLRLLLSEIL
jgi:hypothetical protein